MKDLDIKSETKPLEDNIWKTVQDKCINKDFLQNFPITMVIRLKIDKWEFVTLKSICIVNKTKNSRPQTDD